MGMDYIKNILNLLGNYASILLEFTSVICIMVGFVAAVIMLAKSKKMKSTPLHRRLKLTFGGWLALALEFQLASDIVKTTISPTFDNLIQLGAVAVIRTFLTYFLSREIREDMDILKVPSTPEQKEITKL